MSGDVTMAQLPGKGELVRYEPASAHEFLQAVWNDPGVPLPLRIRAAVEALPFERPKLAATYSLGEGLARKLEAALARSAALDREPPASDQQ
jgi:hypothetical protein